MSESSSTSPHEQQEEVIQLSDLWFIARKHWLLIAITALLGLIIGSIWLINQKPQYKAQAIIQVKNQGSSLSGLSAELGSISGSAGSSLGKSGNNLNDQKALLTSSVVLIPAIKQTQYNIKARPHYFPIFGYWWASRFEGNGLASSFLGLDSYAWGGQKLHIKQLQADTLPIQLTLQAQGSQTFKLYDQDDNQLTQGKVGHTIAASIPHDGQIKLHIASMQALKGNRFTISKTPASQLVNSVQSNLQVSQMGDQTNLLTLSLQSPHPQKAKALLNSILHIAQNQNQQRKARQAKQTLGFLKKQIPHAKKAVNQAQHRLLHYQSKHGSVDLDQQAKILMQRLSSYESSINQLNLKKLAIQRLYTKKHPILQSVNDKIKRLKQQENKLQHKINKLPESDQQALMLKKDLQVKSQLYSVLLQKAQKLKVTKAGTLSDLLTLQNVRVEKASSKLSSSSILALSILLGGFLGFIIAAMRELLRERGLSDLEQLDDILGVDHKAIIPLSKRQKRIDKNRSKGLLTQPVLIAKNHPQDVAVEGLRTLKTALQMSLLDRNQSNENDQGWAICLHGISPSAGKSFIATNLSYLLSHSEQRIVLLDSDLRRSHTTDILELDPNQPDLMSYLDNEAQIEDIIQTWQGSFDVIPTASGIDNTANYINSTRFETLIAELKKQYDIVVMDAPPILGVSDGLILGRHADYNLVVINALEDSIKELRYGFGIFNKHGCPIHGSVINKLEPKQQAGSGVRYHYYRYYHNNKSSKRSSKDKH